MSANVVSPENMERSILESAWLSFVGKAVATKSQGAQNNEIRLGSGGGNYIVLVKESYSGTNVTNLYLVNVPL